jgi:hypothetical protein
MVKIFAFLELEQNWAFFKGLLALVNRYEIFLYIGTDRFNKGR